MSEPIGVGDYVECIEHPRGGYKCARHEGPEIKVGGIYLVRAISLGRYPDGKLDYGLKFSGIRGFDEKGREGAWGASNFKPVYKPKASLIQSLLSDTFIDTLVEA